MRLASRRTERALVRVSTSHVELHEDLRIISVVAMEGDGQGLWGVGVARRGAPPRVRAIGDPREWSDQAGLIEWLGLELDTYLASSRESHPQFVFATPAAVDLVGVAAARFLYSEQEAVRKAAEVLYHAVERRTFANQVICYDAASILSEHFAIGEDLSISAGLAPLLAWCDPGPGGLEASIESALGVGDDLHTPPGLEMEQLVRSLAALGRDRPKSPLLARTRATRVAAAITPLVRETHARISKALDLVDGLGLPPLEDLAFLHESESREFQRFTKSRASGYRMSRRPGTKRAILDLVAAESALENWESARIWGDELERERAYWRGDVLRGQVTSVYPADGAARVVVASNQRLLRLRPGTALFLFAEPKLSAAVIAVERLGDTAEVELEVAGSAGGAILAWQTGQAVEWCPHQPAWGSAVGRLKSRAERFKELPWTHDPAVCLEPAQAGGPVPDLKAIVEGLSAPSLNSGA